MATRWRVYTIISEIFCNRCGNEVQNVETFSAVNVVFISSLMMTKKNQRKRSSQAIFTVDSTIKPTLILHITTIYTRLLMFVSIISWFGIKPFWDFLFISRFFIYFGIFYLFRDFLLFGIFLIFQDFFNIFGFLLFISRYFLYFLFADFLFADFLFILRFLKYFSWVALLGIHSLRLPQKKNHIKSGRNILERGENFL